MPITRETVEHVATLARLALTDDEIERYTRDMGNILALAAQLDALDLSQVAVTLDTDLPPVLRPDEATREFTREALMANAPHEEDGFFRVPKILGD